MRESRGRGTARVVVVGAGMAGLAAARGLVGDDTGPGSDRADLDVALFDKGRSPGGRMATRRIGGAIVDHGAQFFTVRGEAFASRVDRWRAAGLVDVWCHGFDHEPDGHPRHIATGGMSSLAKDLAAGLDVRCDHLVFSVRPAAVGADRRRWRVVIDDGTEHHADAVVVTCPLPQAFSLLVESDVELPTALFGGGGAADGDVDHRDYDRNLALLAVLDGPSAIPPPGGRRAHQLTGTPWSFVGDNHAKGISPVPAVTFHAGPEWSEAHWDDPADELHQQLLDAAMPFVGDGSIIESQVKRWRFATPRTRWPEPYWADPTGTLVLAGDAFGGATIEGAHDSGLAAAAHLRWVFERLSR